MYRIAIVDNESVITDNLEEILKGIKEFEIDIYNFYSAEQVFRLLKQIRVDVFLTNVQDTGTIITDRMMDEEQKNVRSCFEKSAEVMVQMDSLKNLETLLESGKEAEFFEMITALQHDVTGSRELSYACQLELYYGLINMYIIYIRRWGIFEQIVQEFSLRRLTQMWYPIQWKKTLEEFSKLAQRMFYHKKQLPNKSSDCFIERIHHYIDKNISGDTSLITLAGIGHFNPCYLSRLYKKVTGKKLSTYILEAKIVKAKSLLKCKELKINEITEAVGFDSASYFTRLFHKKTGLTPQQYRDMN